MIVNLTCLMSLLGAVCRHPREERRPPNCCRPGGTGGGSDFFGHLQQHRLGGGSLEQSQQYAGLCSCWKGCLLEGHCPHCEATPGHMDILSIPSSEYLTRSEHRVCAELAGEAWPSMSEFLKTSMLVSRELRWQVGCWGQQPPSNTFQSRG